MTAGCGPAPEVGARQPLIGAAETADYEASVFLRAGPGRCSGSLVHPRIVVTAWHCISPEPIQVDVVTSGGTSTYDAVARFTPPGTFASDVEHMAIDVAALVLDRDVAGVVPYVLAYDGLADRVDQPLRGVAYGGGSSLFGRRQTSTGVLICDARRSDSTFDFPMLTTIDGAPGDSGGSVLDPSGALLGVMSGMLPSSGCLHGGTPFRGSSTNIWASRIELSAELVAAAFASIGASPPMTPVDAGSPARDGGTAIDVDSGALAAIDSGALAAIDSGALPDIDSGGGAQGDAGVLDANGSSALAIDAAASGPRGESGCNVGVRGAPSQISLVFFLMLAAARWRRAAFG